MEIFHNALSSITLRATMSSLSLNSAYFSMSLKEELQDQIKYRWNGKMYRFISTPNGLACVLGFSYSYVNSDGALTQFQPCGNKIY